MKSTDLVFDPSSAPSLPPPEVAPSPALPPPTKILVLLVHAKEGAQPLLTEELEVDDTPEAMQTVLGCTSLERILIYAPRYNILADADREKNEAPMTALGVRGNFLLTGILRAEIGKPPRYTGLLQGGKEGEQHASTLSGALSLLQQDD